MSLPKGVSVKVKFLRPRGYDNLREWMSNDRILVTRHGRIFIDKEIFHYPASCWANPYKVGTKTDQYSLEESLKKYEDYLRYLLEDSENYEDYLHEFLTLQYAKEIGCFCDEGQPCHRNIILKLLKEKLNV